MSKTFLEKIKVNERETIMANILAYYFNPKKEHGLGSLFIEAFFETHCYELTKHIKLGRFCTPYDIPKDLNECKVYDELGTNDKKRIDLLIKNDHFALCIEFKINHILNNDLVDYKERTEKAIDSQGESIKRQFYAILTPVWKSPQGSTQSKFKQVILQHFISKVEELKEEKGILLSGKEAVFYEDFIQTIRNRRKLLDAYQDSANNYNDAKEFITEKVKSLQEYIETAPQNPLTVDFFEKKDKLEAGITYKGKRKIRLSLKGWQMEIWKELKLIKSNTKPLECDFEELKNFIAKSS